MTKQVYATTESVAQRAYKDPPARRAGLPRTACATNSGGAAENSAGVHPQLAAVEMASVAAVVWRRKKRELGVDAVRREVAAFRSDVEVDAIAKFERSDRRRRCYLYAGDDAQRDVSYIVVWPPAIGPTRVVTCEYGKPLLLIGWSRIDRQL